MCFNARYVLRNSLKWALRDGDFDEAERLRKIILDIERDDVIKDYFQISAFSHPKVIVYENYKPFKPVVSQWGLIPSWAKDAESIWNTTLNARGETIFEKPSFKNSAQDKRCIIPAEGFYEHHDFKGKKYPFYITRKDGNPLYLAGLWNEWSNKQTGEIQNTFSIVTTAANPLMAKIHNNPKASADHRMPVILPEDLCELWLKPISRKELQELAMYQFPDSELDAWTVRRLSGKESLGNVPEANSKFVYPELDFDSKEFTLF